MASGEHGPGLHSNGDLAREGEESSQRMVSDDMLYKLSKKIAQLTKVIYSLNTKNDDLEFDMENMRHGYEDKLEKVSRMVFTYSSQQYRQWESFHTGIGL